jgi:uncharacterized protein YdeI (YjbR/CyaY-like superfamily)
MRPPKPKAFKTQDDFRAWLQKHHASKTELILRLYKVHALHKGIGYTQALEEALCWGWIDGVVRSLDADSFQQRYSPRKPRSNWSRINIERMEELIAAGKAAPPGIAAFERRDKIAVAPYSFENRNITLSPAFLKRLKANPRAWKFFQSEPPGYRRTTVFWVMQAKKAETREKRFRVMLDRMAKGERMGVLPKKPK